MVTDPSTSCSPSAWYSPTAVLILASNRSRSPIGDDDRVPFEGDLDGVDLGSQVGEHTFERLAAAASPIQAKAA